MYAGVSVYSTVPAPRSSEKGDVLLLNVDSIGCVVTTRYRGYYKNVVSQRLSFSRRSYAYSCQHSCSRHATSLSVVMLTIRASRFDGATRTHTRLAVLVPVILCWCLCFYSTVVLCSPRRSNGNAPADYGGCGRHMQAVGPPDVRVRGDLYFRCGRGEQDQVQEKQDFFLLSGHAGVCVCACADSEWEHIYTSHKYARGPHCPPPPPLPRFLLSSCHTEATLYCGT